MFVRTLSTLSLVGLILSVGAVLPWNDLVLGSLIFLSVLGTAATLVLAIIRRSRRWVRIVRHLHTMATEAAAVVDRTA